mgnify:CR=1 FL=1
MNEITIYPTITIRQAMKKLSQTGHKCLVIVDENNLLLGTLTDGDIRKAILKGLNISNSIENIYKSHSKLKQMGHLIFLIVD